MTDPIIQDLKAQLERVTGERDRLREKNKWLKHQLRELQDVVSGKGPDYCQLPDGAEDGDPCPYGCDPNGICKAKYSERDPNRPRQGYPAVVVARKALGEA